MAVWPPPAMKALPATNGSPSPPKVEGSGLSQILSPDFP
jgi:hypothetical protein